jgi:hypothetical protein
MLHTTIPIGEYPTVYEVTAAQAAHIFSLPEEQQRELARRYVTVGELSGPPEL